MCFDSSKDIVIPARADDVDVPSCDQLRATAARADSRCGVGWGMVGSGGGALVGSGGIWWRCASGVWWDLVEVR